MERGLQEIGGVAYVEGSFVCDNTGEVLASSTPAVLASVTMSNMGREVARAFSALDTAGRAAAYVEFTFDSWRLFARDIGNALLLVVCQPHVDRPTLRMTVDIVTSGWRRDPAAQRRLAGRKAERRDLVSQASLDDDSWRSWRFIESRT